MTTINDDDIHPLLAGLGSADVTARQLAVITLADRLDLDGRALVGPIIPLVADPDPTVRRLAVDLLEELGDAQAVPALIGALDDPAPEVREAAAGALRAIRDEGAVAPLLAAARHPSPAVRRGVILALRELK